MSEYVLIYSTIPTLEEAKTLGKSLVESKLAACINIIPNMSSIYSWEGKIEENNEFILLAKTKKSLEQEIISYIEENHSYECPCVVSLPIESGSKKFLEWITRETST